MTEALNFSNGLMPKAAHFHAGLLPRGNARPILQGSDDPRELAREAKELAPELEAHLHSAVRGIPGAKVIAVRDQKDQDRVEEKEVAGKPVETQPDHLAARITADSPEAKEAVAQRLNQGGEVRREDRYEKEGGPNNFRADTHQVKVPGNALKTAEVQIVTPEQHEAAEKNHDIYERQRSADAKGDTATSDHLSKQLKTANDAAATAAGRRISVQSNPTSKGGRGESPELGGAAQAAPLKKGDAVVLSDGRRATVVFPPTKTNTLPAYRFKLDDGGKTVEMRSREVERGGAVLAPSEKDGGWIGSDLDGTLAKYDHWRGAAHIGEPIPEMVDTIKNHLANGEDVRILTARVADDPGDQGRKAIAKWTEQHLGRRLAVTDKKDGKMRKGYDDRFSTVERNTGRILAEPTPDPN